MKPMIPILVLFLAGFPGCAYYDSTPDGGKSCKNHGDCPDDHRCLDGACLSEPPPCGEDIATGCAWGLKDPQECAAAGGWFECSWLDPSWCWCECPSGDAGCPCWQGFHCQGHCLGDQENCIKLQVGECSDTKSYLPLGCWCVAYAESDSFTHVCAD